MPAGTGEFGVKRGQNRMSEEGESKEPEQKSLGGELVIPIGAFLFTIYYFYTIWDVPRIAQVSAFFVGTILMVLIGVLILRVVGEVRAGRANLGLGRLIEPNSYIPKRLALFGLTLGFIFFVDWLGFTLTVFVFLSLSMLLLNEGKRKGLILGLSTALALGGYLLFIVAFKTRFPSGPFEEMMKGLL